MTPSSTAGYRSHVGRLFVAHAQALGCDVDGLGLACALDDDGAVELPFPALVALCDRVAALVADPYVGLAIGSALPPGTYGVAEYAFASSATVGDALDTLRRFHAVATRLASTAVRRDAAAGTVTFQHWVDHPAARTAVHVDELALATYQRLGELHLGFRPRFVAVHVAHDRAERRDRLEAHFAAPVVVGASRNALVLDAALLARPMPQADPRLLAILTERAERDLSSAGAPGGTAAQLAAAYRSLVLATPHRAQAHDAARALGTSVRSLHRRLAAEGTSFRAIEADVKRALANELLARPGASVERVAAAVGFATASAFIRAYKRWTGHTPIRARDRVAGSGNKLA